MSVAEVVGKLDDISLSLSTTSDHTVVSALVDLASTIANNNDTTVQALDGIVQAVDAIEMPTVDLSEIGTMLNDAKDYELPAFMTESYEAIERAIANYNDHSEIMAHVLQQLEDFGSADISKLDTRLKIKLARVHPTCPSLSKIAMEGPIALEPYFDEQTCEFGCPLRLFASWAVYQDHQRKASEAADKRCEAVEKKQRTK